MVNILNMPNMDPIGLETGVPENLLQPFTFGDVWEVIFIASNIFWEQNWRKQNVHQNSSPTATQWRIPSSTPG